MTGEHHLAAPHVAEQPEGQRDRLEELEQPLQEADEEVDGPIHGAVPEAPQVDVLAEVAAHAQDADALDVEDEEADEGQAGGHVEVARRRPQPLDPSEEDHPAQLGGG
jgi:hypothetical protein